jgi:predicted transcriptional regulator
MCDSETDSTSLADTHADLSRLFQDPGRTSQEVVRSVFDLKQHETRAYLALVKQPNSTVTHIADALDRHQRHAARSLRGLHDAGLVEREQQNLDTGGQGYIYDPVPVKETKQYLQNQLDRWVAHLRSEIENFDTRIETETRSGGCSQPKGEQ